MTITTLRYPTPLSTLLADETYEIYFGRKPKLAKNVREITPAWLVLAHTRKGKWKRKLISDYREAVTTTLRLLDDEKYRDVCLISRRKTFTKPIWIDSIAPFEEWCGQCRRPTLFQEFYGDQHHGVYGPIYLQGEKRCFFCGVRKEYIHAGRY